MGLMWPGIPISFTNVSSPQAADAVAVNRSHNNIKIPQMVGRCPRSVDGWLLLHLRHISARFSCDTINDHPVLDDDSNRMHHTGDHRTTMHTVLHSIKVCHDNMWMVIFLPLRHPSIHHLCKKPFIYYYSTPAKAHITPIRQPINLINPRHQRRSSMFITFTFTLRVRLPLFCVGSSWIGLAGWRCLIVLPIVVSVANRWKVGERIRKWILYYYYSVICCSP